MTFQQQVRERRPPNGNSDSTTTCYQWKSQKKKILSEQKKHQSVKIKRKDKWQMHLYIYKALHTHSTPAVKISQPLTWCPCYAHTPEQEHTTPNSTKKKNHTFSAAAFWQSWNVTIRQKILHLKSILQHISNIVKFTASPHCTLWKLLQFGNSHANQPYLNFKK